MSVVPSRIRSTGELRAFLLDVMVGVKAGTVEVSKASSITKLAQQTTENLYAELKAKRLAIESEQPSVELGQLQLGDK